MEDKLAEKNALLEELKEMHQFLGELIAEFEENPRANIPFKWAVEQLRPVLGK